MKTRLFVLLLFLIFVSPGSLSAQGLFQGFSFPVTVASTGQTEIIGMIIASLTFGPAAADTLVIDVSPLQITNASAADISVTATLLTFGATTIDTTNSLIEIPVQQGFASSGAIRIQGIRVAVAGTNMNSFNARLSWLNLHNAFTAGASVPVINAVQSGLVAQSIPSSPAAFDGQFYTTNSTIQLAEGFPGAFSSSSQYGQTGPTQFQITLNNFPAGGQMNFPTSVTANETGSTLFLTAGQPSTVTGNATVTYGYSSAGNTAGVAESFNLNVSVVEPAATGNVQPKIQVTLAPIGAAVPSATFTSTSIPRYAESDIAIVPAAQQAVSEVLYWTGINAPLQGKVEITNPNSQTSGLTIDAFDSNGKAISGTAVTNPVKLRLLANQSLVSAVSDLFGTAAGISSIRIQSTTPDLLAAMSINGGGISQTVPFVSNPVTSMILPVASGSAMVQLMNTSTLPVTGTVTLFSAAGQVVSPVAVNLAGLASTTLTLQTLFGMAPQSGYASAVFSGSVIAYESSGQSTLEVVRPPASAASVFVPFVAGGSSFQTTLNLISASSQTITLNALLFTASGSQLATQSITMQPGQQIAESIPQIFSQSPDAGYVQLVLPQIGKAFFISYPLIAGQAELDSSPGGSTIVPLSDSQSSSAFILPLANAPAGFEGIALLNPSPSQVTVNVRALNLDGSIAASASLTLGPGQMATQLTSQLFNGSLPAQAVIRITSSAPIVATAISGSTDLKQILALPVM